jgi:hypothetical protein
MSALKLQRLGVLLQNLSGPIEDRKQAARTVYRKAEAHGVEPDDDAVAVLRDRNERGTRGWQHGPRRIFRK